MKAEITYKILGKGQYDFKTLFGVIFEQTIKTANSFLGEIIFLSNQIVRPFAYCTFSSRKKVDEFDLRIIFSSTYPEIFVLLYNRLFLKEKFSFEGLTFIRRNVFLRPLVKISQPTAIFKTLSPVILDIKDPKWYLKEDQEDIENKVKNLVNRQSEFYLKKVCENFKFIPKELYKIAIRYDNNILQGFEGIFEIQAPAEVLNLIFNTGLGLYWKNGFGMIDLV